jgi:predicted membrane GTPase involved in stress response
MIIGENNKGADLVVNALREKKQSNSGPPGQMTLYSLPLQKDDA